MRFIGNITLTPRSIVFIFMLLNSGCSRCSPLLTFQKQGGKPTTLLQDFTVPWGETCKIPIHPHVIGPNCLLKEITVTKKGSNKNYSTGCDLEKYLGQQLVTLQNNFYCKPYGIFPGNYQLTLTIQKKSTSTQTTQVVCTMRVVNSLLSGELEENSPTATDFLLKLGALMHRIEKEGNQRIDVSNIEIMTSNYYVCTRAKNECITACNNASLYKEEWVFLIYLDKKIYIHLEQLRQSINSSNDRLGYGGRQSSGCKKEGPEALKREGIRVFNKYYNSTIPEAESYKKLYSIYRKLALKTHPDKNRDDPQARSKFEEISTAWEKITTWNNSQTNKNTTTKQDTKPKGLV